MSRDDDATFRAIYENATIGIAIASLDGKFDRSNRAFCQLLGYSEEELRGRPFETIMHPDDRGANSAILNRLVAGEITSFEIENRYLHKDGHPVWVRKTVSLSLDAHGRPANVIVLAIDLSSSKIAEKALRASEERQQLFIEHAPVALAIFDKEMRYLSVSRRWLEDYGLRDRNLLGLSHYDVFPEIPERWREVHRRALIGEIERSEEERFVRASGEEQWLRWEVRPWRDGGGTIGGIVIFSEDVSKRKRTERALQESEARLRAIVDTAVDSIIVIDECGSMQSVNPATHRIFGYTAEELLGHNVKMLMPERYARNHDRSLQVYRETGERNIIGIGREVEGRRKDGSIFPLDLGVAEWRDPGGRRFYTGLVRDISERKQSEERLAGVRRLEAVGQLAGGVAHDFNNLLTVIAGNLELAEGQVVEESTRRLIRRARDAAEMGGSFNRRLLALAHRRKLEPHRVLLTTRVEETKKLIERALGENIELSTVLESDPWITIADPGEIDSALLNLVVNARDAMPNGGRIVVAVWNVSLNETAARLHPDARPGDYVRLSVTDTGTGMSPETLSHALEPFYTTKGPGRGTGLGLSSVASFAKQSGGFVTLSSTLGKGTTATLYLPRASDEVAATRGSATGGPPLGDGELVLVVEDEDHVREVTLKRLEALGYAVIEARTAGEAIELLRSTPEVDVVFSDIVMPGGMSGYELAQWVKTTMPKVRVVLTSGYHEVETGAAEPLPAGEVPVLDKPYTRDQLGRALRDVLGTVSGETRQTSAVNT